jgi:hypothetical protein
MANTQPKPQPATRPDPQSNDDAKRAKGKPAQPTKADSEDIDISESTGGSALEQEAGALAAGRP